MISYFWSCQNHKCREHLAHTSTLMKWWKVLFVDKKHLGSRWQKIKLSTREPFIISWPQEQLRNLYIHTSTLAIWVWNSLNIFLHTPRKITSAHLQYAYHHLGRNVYLLHWASIHTLRPKMTKAYLTWPGFDLPKMVWVVASQVIDISQKATNQVHLV